MKPASIQVHFSTAAAKRRFIDHLFLLEDGQGIPYELNYNQIGIDFCKGFDGAKQPQRPFFRDRASTIKMHERVE